MKTTLRDVFPGLLLMVLTACGGGSSSPAPMTAPTQTTSTPMTPSTYTIGGTVTGLTGSGLVLQNNGGGDLAVSSATGAFTFTAGLADGAAYAVTVKTQPTSPQNCVVTNGSGTVDSANVIDVAVVCVGRFAYAVCSFSDFWTKC